MNNVKKTLSLLTALLLVPLAALHADEPPHILIREALQFENIGDSGRVPGTIRQLYQYLPEATVTLWPWQLHEREREMLTHAFPKLHIASGEVDDAGHASTPELAAAWKDADIFITPARHAKTFQAWAKTGRPYGFFGSHFDPISGRTSLRDGGTLEKLREAITKLPADHFDGHYKSREVYDGASFIFARDTYSLLYLQGQKLRTPIVEFGLDGTFGIAVRDEARATRWLKRIGAEQGKFICVLPRLRYTPYYRVKDLPRDEGDYEIDAINAKHAAADHAPLRDLITLYARETGHKVLLCPEMTYEITVAKEHLFDPLPADVKPHVIWRDTFWLADEAASVYARATAIVSAECHSPIIALSQGTPAFYVRNPPDTVKAQMFRDLGLTDWVFESHQTTGQQLWKKLKPIHENRAAGRAKVQAAMQRATDIQKRMVEVVADAVAKHQAKASR
ncbi:MAG: polysaccharide pyruvyl transferase family protein [Verrucomicrobia bacterium]|nr:polysaccharide pyruvyl transferase family protein [Verrucomicrobiota bacterium]